MGSRGPQGTRGGRPLQEEPVRGVRQDIYPEEGSGETWADSPKEG